MELRHNADESRYEAIDDGRVVGFAEYVEREGRYFFTHTAVDDEFEGRGIGSGIVEFALDDMMAKGAKVVPRCSFVAAFIQHHDTYAGLVG